MELLQPKLNLLKKSNNCMQMHFLSFRYGLLNAVSAVNIICHGSYMRTMQYNQLFLSEEQRMGFIMCSLIVVINLLFRNVPIFEKL